MAGTELDRSFADTSFATQSTLRHVAIIMDGNRRWATQRGCASGQGHSAGVENAISIVRASADLDFECLTLFAFSSANWNRPKLEVDHLFKLAERALKRLSQECVKARVRLQIIGRQDRLPRALRWSLNDVVHRTRLGDRCLRIALDYSARESILRAAKRISENDDVDELDRLVCGAAPPVDLLIRTGKERRLSDFMLWECAFAELYFSDLHWPEFDANAFREAITWFHHRSRRFGG